MAKNSIASLAVTLALAMALPAAAGAAPPAAIEVTPARVRARGGERLEFRVRTSEAAARAVLVVPGSGARAIELEALPTGERRAVVELPGDAPAGFHLLHVWTGDAARPRAVGKAAILNAPVILDFTLPTYLDKSDPLADLAAYLDDFQGLGGNALIAHGLITPDRAWFPSATTRAAARRGAPDDFVEHVLSEADRRGMAVFLSVSWDMTRQRPYRERMAEIAAIMAELYSLYAGHPSLAGFYSYQEGSGTYYVPYVRQFTGHVKQLNPGLLSACAPFVDDPLLAGYLSTVESLDVMIFQGQVMASYRTDNRKRYPLRRVRDFAALGIGAKWLQDKIAITHVELFGYLENRPDPAVLAASEDNILGQIASVATAPGADGLSLFAYQPHIWSARRHPRVERSRQAVAAGLRVFQRAQQALGATRNPLAVYVPYSDWIVERWTTSILPGLDGLRRAGLPADILPYAPPIEESDYPYFPFHMNTSVLERLLARRRVLVLTDVSGFQQTDSDLVDAFVRRGGVVVAFGPQIPMGRSYERDILFGGREAVGPPGRQVRAAPGAGRRTKAGFSCTLDHPPPARWEATTARVLATFADGSPAVLANTHGEGLAVAILPPAADFAAGCLPLMRDVLETALARAGQPLLAEVDGLTNASDLAVSESPSGLALTIVNHEQADRTVAVRPLTGDGAWFDRASGQALGARHGEALEIVVPAGGVRLIELRRGGGRQP